MSNLIKYNFVNLKDKDAFVVSNKENPDNFVPLQKTRKVKIRPADEVEKEEAEKAESAVLKKQSVEDDFSPGVPVMNFDEVFKQKEADARRMADGIIEAARQQANEIVAEANAKADEVCAKAREEGMASGKEEGLMLAKDELESIRQQLAAERANLDNEYQNMIRQIEPRYVEVLCSLIQKLTGVILEEYTDVLLHLIRSSIADMPASEKYIIRVCSEDAISLEARKAELESALEKGVTIEIQEEKGLERERCIIESDTQMIDCGFQTQLHNLMNTLRLLTV